jgi:magnesium-transporting ATPase (P-type)
VWALSGGRFPLALGVLQVLCLDVGTDILPAVALGAEPSSPRALARRPAGRHLIDGGLLRRALLVLGLTESVVSMAAFLAVLFANGWRAGLAIPTGAALLSASGAAFTAVVAGQMANAFACRSATLWPGRLGWGSNPLLIAAVLCEAIMLMGFLYIPPLAAVLGHAAPPAPGYAVAALAFPCVLLADLLEKRFRGSASLPA